MGSCFGKNKSNSSARKGKSKVEANRHSSTGEDAGAQKKKQKSGSSVVKSKPNFDANRHSSTGEDAGASNQKKTELSGTQSESIPVPETPPAPPEVSPAKPPPSSTIVQSPEDLPPKQPPSLNTNQSPEESPAKPSYQPLDVNQLPPAKSSEPIKVETLSSSENSKPFRKDPNKVLEKPFENVKSHFKIVKELGKGPFGATYLCTEKSTNKQFACRSIFKRSFVSEHDEEGLRREVKIMQLLNGHPNIVKLKGAYEDKQCVHLVMQLCTGGTFFDRFISKGRYSEKDAAFVFEAIVNVVDFCHSKGIVMYRDLRPENFLFSSKNEDAILKATSFGMSGFVKEGNVYKDVVGSAYYAAPEELQGCYGKEIDIWSVGVMLYMLLSGDPPFLAKTNKGTFDTIKKGKVQFDNCPWRTISTSAQDLIRKMLTQDPRKRITSSQVLEHPWIRENGGRSNNPIDCEVLCKLKKLGAMEKLMKLAHKVVAENLSWEEIEILKSLFKTMVTNGTITYRELKTGLAKFEAKLRGDEFSLLLDALDVDEDRTIDYNDFIAATMQRKRLREERFLKTLQNFDKGSIGLITRDELQAAMKQCGMSNDEALKEIISKVDIDKNDKINYEEVTSLMKRDQHQELRKTNY